MRKKKIVRSAAAAFIVCSLCLPSMRSFADDAVEPIEFVATTGTQWMDTGLSLNFKRSRFRVNFRVVERPTGRVALCGALHEKDNVMGYNGGIRRSFAVRIGSDVDKGTTTYRVYPSFSGSEDNAYLFPITGSYDESASIEVEGYLATAWFNGKRFAGYYDASRPDEFTEEGKSFYIGNVNNAGEGVLTPDGQMAKIHWYGAKFWTDDELVGDFVPAMRNGEAGFYDNVTKRFFASQGTEPFVAPNRIKWTGGGNLADFTDGDNWDGGAAPAGMADVAFFPAGAEVGATFSDIKSFFTGLGCVHLAGEDTLFAVTSATENVSMYAPIYGKGTYRVASGSDAYHYFIFADSGHFEGRFDFTNAAWYVETCAPNAAGIDGKATANFYADGSKRRLSFAKAIPTRANWRIAKSGQFAFTAEGVTMHGGLAFLGDPGLSFHANGTYFFDFRCSITNETDSRRTLSLTSGEYRLNDASRPKHFGKMQVQAASLAVNSPITFDVQQPDYSIYNQCNVAILNNGKKGLTFGAENVLQTNLFLVLNYADLIQDGKRCSVNLGGYDQRIGTLGVYAREFNAMEVWNTNLVIMSESPATLTIHGSVRCDAAKVDGIAVQGVFPGRVCGAASITLDSCDDVDSGPMFANGGKSIRFCSPLSDTTGSLTAKRGTVHVMQTATFSNLTSVAVSGDGVMQIDTPNVGNANDEFLVSVTNATGGRLTISDGVTLKTHHAYMNDRWLGKGLWSSEESDGVRKCAWLSGGGVLEVEEFGGPVGMRVILR